MVAQGHVQGFTRSLSSIIFCDSHKTSLGLRISLMHCPCYIHILIIKTLVTVMVKVNVRFKVKVRFKVLVRVKGKVRVKVKFFVKVARGQVQCTVKFVRFQKFLTIDCL